MSKNQKRTEAERKEILNKQVNISGAGEAEVLQDLFSKEFIEADDRKAAQIAAGLKRLIDGYVDERFEEQMARFMAWAEEREREREKFEKDRIKWFEEQFSKMEKLKSVTETDKARSAARAQKIAEEAREEIQAESAAAQLEFQKRWHDSPKETITSSGIPVETRNGIVFEPEVLSIQVGTKTKHIVFYPDQPTEVPKFIADIYRERKNMGRELNKLDDALKISSNNEMKNFDEIAKKFPEINPSGRIRPEDIINSILPKE